MSVATILDPEVVNAIFMDCLFREGEKARRRVAADGITSNVVFHPERLESHRSEIEALLAELPDEFKFRESDSHRGGASFLKACNDRRGNQWTGSHQRMEQLFQLGIGIGKVNCLFPREMWFALPGGMPCYVVIS